MSKAYTCVFLTGVMQYRIVNTSTGQNVLVGSGSRPILLAQTVSSGATTTASRPVQAVMVRSATPKPNISGTQARPTAAVVASPRPAAAVIATAPNRSSNSTPVPTTARTPSPQLAAASRKIQLVREN